MFLFHGDLKNVGRSGGRESGYQTLRYPDLDIREEIRHVIFLKKFTSGQKVLLQQTGSRNLKIVGRIGKHGRGAGIGNHSSARISGYDPRTVPVLSLSLSLSFRVGTRAVD